MMRSPLLGVVPYSHLVTRTQFLTYLIAIRNIIIICATPVFVFALRFAPQESYAINVRSSFKNYKNIFLIKKKKFIFFYKNYFFIKLKTLRYSSKRVGKFSSCLRG
jgi:hypothetical protein